jgi:hypothetical protein
MLFEVDDLDWRGRLRDWLSERTGSCRQKEKEEGTHAVILASAG